MKTTIRTDLLRQLANHLLNGNLGHKVFDFSTFNKNPKIKFDEMGINECQTNGCAAGECPILWPDKFEFQKQRIKLIASDKMDFEALSNFFCLSDMECNHLFSPSEHKYNWITEEYNETEWDTIYQNISMFGGKILDDNSTKEEVVNNILIFCDKAENGDF